MTQAAETGQSAQGPFSKLDLRRLIIPLIIEQTLALTIGMFDTIMIASVGEGAVSGVSLVESINMLLINLFAALAAGGAIVAGQYLGRSDRKSGCHAAKQLVVSTFFLSLFIMVLCLALNRPILSLCFGQIEGDVMASARTYFYITAVSYPFIAVYNAAAALFRGMGNSKVAMINSFIMNIINIGGNALFIFGFGWGVFGAALSTTISRVIAAITMLLMLRSPNLAISVSSYHLKDLDFSMIKRILRIGIPNGLENSIVQIGRILVTSLVAGMGTVAIASHAVASSLVGIAVIPGVALGFALITVVAQCAGAGQYSQANGYMKYLMKLSYLYMVFTNIGMLLLAKPLLGFYQLSDETFRLAFILLSIHNIGAIFIWSPAFTLPNAFRAAGDVKFPMAISIASMWIFRIGLSYLLAYGFHMGVLSVWIAMVVDWAVRVALFTWRWASGRWKNHAVA